MEEAKIEKNVYIDGIRFSLDEKSLYYSGYSNGEKTKLHRYIWEKYNGPIPEGYEIHHIDRNKLNNDISNLTILTTKDHHALHARLMTDEERERSRKILEERARPKACEWHGSEEGRKWHSKHGKEVSEHLHDVKIKKICKCCGKEFYDNGFNSALFCSNNCKSKWRRDAGLDNEKRTCIICGKEFITNKYSKAKACSPACTALYGHVSRKSRISEETGRESDSVQYDSVQKSQLFDF